jgi:hypothetical protein
VGIRDQDYYRRRLAQESAAAQNASSACARDVHLDLAARYSAKLKLIQALSADAPVSEPRLEAAPARRTALG